MKRRNLFNRLATALVVVSLLALGGGPALAGHTTRYGDDTPTALVLVPLDGTVTVAAAQAAGLTLYGRFSGPRGVPVGRCRVRAGKSEPAAGIPFRVLDRDTAGGTYYLAMMPPGIAGPDWAAYGRVLLDDGAQVLLRTTPGAAERLAEAGAEIAQITLAPMVVEQAEVGAPAAPAAITPDPLIQGMLNQVSSTTVSAYTAQLSGEQPVTLSDGSYTIVTRHTASGTPIQKARQFVGEHLAALGYSVEYHDGARRAIATRTWSGSVPGR